VPARVRHIAGQSFAFVPHRFLRDRFFASLSADELQLYFLLVLAADRFGVSYYHHDTICRLLGVPLERYLAARAGLIDDDLIAFDGTRFQVLSLPPRPVRSPAPLAAEQRRDCGLDALDSARRGAGRSQLPPAPSAPQDNLPLSHRNTHPDPAAHPECRDCGRSQRVQQLLRETIAALELKANRPHTTRTAAAHLPSSPSSHPEPTSPHSHPKPAKK
jgi:hypothetical protein